MLRQQSLILGALLIALAGVESLACNAVTGADDLNLGQAGAGGSGGATTTSSTTTSSASSAISSSSSASSSSASSSTSGVASSSSASSAASTGSGGTDPFAQNRQDCIDKINALRATKSLSPYQRWESNESCVDQQATHDESVNKAHDAFNNGTPSCGGLGQNECPNWGADNITGCLDQMWAERTQTGCSGCDACDTFTIFEGNCPNCSFFGPPVCGHYVLLSSAMVTGAACGFSTDGQWAAIDFQ